MTGVDIKRRTLLVTSLDQGSANGSIGEASSSTADFCLGGSSEDMNLLIFAAMLGKPECLSMLVQSGEFQC